jgi:hypothetical protein
MMMPTRVSGIVCFLLCIFKLFFDREENIHLRKELSVGMVKFANASC